MAGYSKKTISKVVVNNTINAVNATNAINATNATNAAQAVSASYALTASYAMNGGGGGGTPGGSNTQIQYNNDGAFGGVPTLIYSNSLLKATGSFTGSFVGILTGTSSWAISASQALTASFAPNYVLNSTTSSFITTGSSGGTQTISGSLVINQNLIVLGSASITNISQSTLNIGTNLITVNTNTPGVRYGGLAVIDSGSSPQRSGSILFDSQNNQWIFVHQNGGANVTSSVFIQGPQTFNNIGNETTLTTNKVPKATGGDLGEHIGDSNITDTGTVIQLGSATQVTGSLNVSEGITGSLFGTSSLAINVIQNAPVALNLYSALGSNTKAEPIFNQGGLLGGSAQTMIHQTLYGVAVQVPQQTTITGVKWYRTNTGGVYTAGTYNGVGLYSYSAGTLTLVASSSNTPNLWSSSYAAANAFVTRSFETSYVANPGIYFAVALYTTASQTTAPVIGTGVSALFNIQVPSYDYTNGAKHFIGATGRTTLASSTAISTLGGSLTQVYLALY
jgi:hypothetical protein